MADSSTTLILAVIQPEDASALLTVLSRAAVGATYISARGGFLRRQSVALIILVKSARIPIVVEAVRQTCSQRTAMIAPVAEVELGFVPEPIEVEIGGAILFGMTTLAALQLTSVNDADAQPSIWRDLPEYTAQRPHEVTEPMISLPHGGRSTLKLLIAMVPDRATDQVIAGLVEHQIGATSVGSTGRLLRQGVTTIISGINTEQVDHATAIIRSACTLGGLTRESGQPVDPEGAGLILTLPVAWRLRL